MLDIKYIRENVNRVKEAIKNKRVDLNLDQLIEIDEKRRKLQGEINELQTTRNILVKKIKEAGGKPEKKQIEQGKKLKAKISDLEEEQKKIKEKYLNLMVKVPTIPSADTPVGKDETENVEVFRWREPTKFDFKPKDYIELGEKLDLLDLKRGVKVAGYRGYYVKNEAVLIQMGLMMLALKKLIGKGFTPIIPPTLVREFALLGSGYFAGQQYNPQTDNIYKIANDEKLADGSVQKEAKFLIGTAEPSLLAYHADEVLTQAQLPLKLCGFSQCYRSEIGSHGKDTKGIYRVHEFMKVEQVCIAKADVNESEKLHQEMITISKKLHEDLELPYRQLQICTGDMGVGKYKMFDLEVWIPSRNSYGESGSASNFLDWQSRRLNVKYRTKDGTKKHVYMLNNTALASARMLIAIIENYQNADGSVTVPKVLQEYVGKECIGKEIK